VLEELLGNRKSTMVVLLQEGEALPKSTRALRWIREGADLVGPNRLVFVQGRWQKA